MANKCIDDVINEITKKYNVSKPEAAQHTFDMELVVKRKINEYTKGTGVLDADVISKIKEDINRDFTRSLKLKIMHADAVSRSKQFINDIYTSDTNISKYDAIASFLGASQIVAPKTGLSVENAIDTSTSNLFARFQKRILTEVSDSAGNKHGTILDVVKQKANDENFNNNVYRELYNYEKGGEPVTKDMLAYKVAEAYKLTVDDAYNLAATFGFPKEKLENYAFKNIHDVDKMLGNKFESGGAVDNVIKNSNKIKGDKPGNAMQKRLDVKAHWVDTQTELLDLNKVYADNENMRITEETIPSDILKGIDSNGVEIEMDISKIKNDLSDSFDRIISNEHKETELNTFDFASRYEKKLDITKKFSSGKRKYHYKDADAWLEYKKLYGSDKNFQELMFDSLQNFGLDIGLLQTLGPDPEGAFSRIIELFKVQDSGIKQTYPELQMLNKKEETKLWNIMDEITGKANTPVNNTFARVSSNLRGFNIATKLGEGGITSLFGDAAVAPFAMKNMGFEFIDSLGNLLSNQIDGWGGKFTPGTKEYDVLLEVATYFEGLNMDIMKRYGSRDFTSKIIKRMSDFTIKWSGLKGITENSRHGYTFAIAKKLGSLSDKTFAELGDDITRSLERYGITEDHWDALRSVIDEQEVEGVKFFTPELVSKLTKEQLQELYDIDYPSKTALTLDGYKEVLTTNLRTLFKDTVDNAILTPGVREMALLHQGTRPGTLSGEGIRQVGFLRSFGLTYVTRVLAGLGYKNGVVIGGTGRAAFKGVFKKEMVGMLAWSLVVGTMATMTSDAVKGQYTSIDELKNDPKKMKNYLIRVINKSGFLGLYTDLLLNAKVGYGKSILDHTLGLQFQQLSDGLATIGNVAGNINDLDEKDLIKIVNLLNYNAMPNILGAKLALDNIVFSSIYEFIDPGYMSELQDKRLENTGKKNFIPYMGGY